MPSRGPASAQHRKLTAMSYSARAGEASAVLRRDADIQDSSDQLRAVALSRRDRSPIAAGAGGFIELAEINDSGHDLSEERAAFLAKHDQYSA